LFKIGEFSKLVRVSARMLRYYEQNGLLAPAEVDRFTGYRLYAAAQIPLLSRITQLRDMGFGVDEIKALLPQFDDSAAMHEALQRKHAQVQSAIVAEQQKLEQIAALRGQLQKKESNTMVFEVQLKHIPAEQVLALRETVPTPQDEPELWQKLAAFVQQRGIDAAICGYSIYHDDGYKETDADIEIAVNVPVPGASEGNFQFKELPAIAQCATVQFSGPYTGFNEAFTKLASWIETNGYQMVDGPIRGKAIRSYVNAMSEADFLTELQVPVKKA